MRSAPLASLIPSLSELAVGSAILCLGLGIALAFVAGVARLLKISFGLTLLGSIAVTGTVLAVVAHRDRVAQFERCDAGDHRTCALLGNTLLLSKKPAEKAKGVAILRRECETGQTGCCGTLAYDESLSHDPATLRLALEDYEKDCNGGSAYGCGKAGRMHLVGPAPRDAVVAARFLMQACAGSTLPAECTNLAALYRRGEGVPHEPVRAAELNKRLCNEQGWDYLTGTACLLLSEQYAAGDGVAKDDRLAEHYRTRANRHGVPLAE